jgi:hypothetical protein
MLQTHDTHHRETDQQTKSRLVEISHIEGMLGFPNIIEIS